MTDDLSKLAAAVKARREELGLSQMQVWKEHQGPSSTKLGDIEAAKPPAPSNTTKGKLEHALRWEKGSVDQLLSGGSATPATPVRNVRRVDFATDDGLTMHYVAPASDQVPREEMRQLEVALTNMWHFARIVSAWAPDLQDETDQWAQQGLGLFSAAVQVRLQPHVEAMIEAAPDDVAADDQGDMDAEAEAPQEP